MKNIILDESGSERGLTFFEQCQYCVISLAPFYETRHARILLERERFVNHLRRLTKRIVLLGNHYLSAYLIIGRRSHTLVEPGISSTAELIVDQIKLLGLEVSSISRLVLMHAHADHITGAPILKKMMPGLKVMTGSETQRLIAKENIQRIFAREDREISNRLLKLEAIDKHAPVAAPLEGIVDEIINPGHALRLDGLSLEVLDAPGHCLGGIALWEPEEGVLFCSDYLGFFLPPGRFVPNFYVNLDDYMATFEYLSRLRPACVCPGHCGAYSGEESLRFIAQARSEVEWVCKFVRGHCETPARLEQVAEELFRRYYVREATMFSAESTRYCMELIIRRILNSNGFTLEKV